MNHPIAVLISKPSRLAAIQRMLAMIGFLIGIILSPLPARAQNVPPGQISKGAYRVITNRVGAVRSSFYVYKDADSGDNHGFPSGVFGNLSSIHILPACVDSPSAPSGISTSSTQTDSVRGTVMSITFDPQAPGTFVGLNIEEPENWGGHQGLPSNGYDLRGAVNLVFDVRTPTAGGVWVQFGVGGGTTNYMYIPKSTTYSTVTIPLASLSPAVDLSNVHILFAVAANAAYTPNGGTVLLDNIHFDPPPLNRATALGFPLATQTFGINPATASPFPLDQVLRNLTTIYESSLTLATLLKRGYPADLRQARMLADTFDYALAHDNHGDLLPTAPDGSAGLHSAYFSGDIALFNSQSGPGRAGEIRLSGFGVQTATYQFDLVLDGATGGNNAFAIIALAAAYKQFNDPRYLADAQNIGKWIYGNLLDNTGTGYGGYYVGYFDTNGGALNPRVKIQGKSTENNADIFAAFTTLATIDSSYDWTTRANIAGDFVMKMFDPATGHFHVGTVPTGNGTNLNQGILPDSSTTLGNDVINKFDFLDTNTFATLAMAGAPRYATTNWRLPLQYVINNFSRPVTTNSGAFSFNGFSLVKSPISRVIGGVSTSDNGITWEFVGQMVAAMRFVDTLYGETAFASTAQFFLNQIGSAQLSAPFGDGLGLVASTEEAGDLLPPLQQGFNTPYQDIPERVGLAATTWAVLADKNINFFSLLNVVPVIPTDVGRDVNGDGIPDLIFQNGIGQVYGWFLDGSGSPVNFTTGTGLKGTGFVGSGYLYTGGLADWRVMGVGDLNGDGIPDLIFQNGIGQVYGWFLNGSGSPVNFTTGAGLKGTGSVGSGYLYPGALGDWRVH